MDLAGIAELRALARRLSRREADIEDLVQDTLLAALEADRFDAAWLHGVMRNQAALAARGAVRRRRREADAGGFEASDPPRAEEGTHEATTATVVRALPPGARRVAVLALHGLGADEIRWILGLAPTAFRQRLTTIRKRLGQLPPAQQAEALALAYLRDPTRVVDLQLGLVRRALKAALRGEAGLATHDVDGHLLVIRGRAHTSRPVGNDEETATRPAAVRASRT
jgi:DNA-directed RNA polymerase specialized sigma24 family protein